MIIADTSVWIDYILGKKYEQTDLLDSELLNGRVATGDISTMIATSIRWKSTWA